MDDELESLNHPVWECKFHVVFIPKCRRKVLHGELRRYLVRIPAKPIGQSRRSRSPVPEHRDHPGAWRRWDDLLRWLRSLRQGRICPRKEGVAILT
jgi:hypothetical protein